MESLDHVNPADPLTESSWDVDTFVLQTTSEIQAKGMVEALRELIRLGSQ